MTTRTEHWEYADRSGAVVHRAIIDIGPGDTVTISLALLIQILEGYGWVRSTDTPSTDEPEPLE